MALSATDMKSKVEAAITAAGITVTDNQFNLILYLCQGIVEEITSNALVTVTGVVTSGVGAGGAVTGTGTIS